MCSSLLLSLSSSYQLINISTEIFFFPFLSFILPHSLSFFPLSFRRAKQKTKQDRIEEAIQVGMKHLLCRKAQKIAGLKCNVY